MVRHNIEAKQKMIFITFQKLPFNKCQTNVLICKFDRQTHKYCKTEKPD